MSEKSFRGLGFDPAPGTVDSVRALAESLADAGRAVGDAAGRLTDAVTTSAAWRGGAADEFRLRGNALPPRLHGNQETMTAAAEVLFGWATTLADLQRQAERFDRRARGLTGRIVDAERLVEEWVTAVSVASTHVRPQAEATLATHGRTLAALRAELAAIRDEARRLGAEHRLGAERTVARLRTLTGGSAAHAAPRPALVAGVGTLLTDLAAHARRASAALVPTGAAPARPPGGLAVAVAALAEPGTGRTWTFGEM